MSDKVLGSPLNDVAGVVRSDVFEARTHPPQRLLDTETLIGGVVAGLRSPVVITHTTDGAQRQPEVRQGSHHIFEQVGRAVRLAPVSHLQMLLEARRKPTYIGEGAGQIDVSVTSGLP